MKNYKIKNFGLIAAAMLIGTYSYAMGGKSIRMDMDIEHSAIEYQQTKQSTNEVQYDLSKNEARVVISANGRRDVQEANVVPGKNAKGYSKLSIKKISQNKVLMTFNQLSYGEVEGREYSMEMNISTEAYFSKGNWRDYVRGQAVELNMTPEQEQTYNNQLKDLMKREIEKQLNIQFEGRARISVSVDEFRFKNARMEIDNKKLSQSTTGKISMTINVYQ